MSQEDFNKLEAVYAHCPDCGLRGRLVNAEQTTMGSIRAETGRQAEDLVCVRDPNRNTEQRVCSAGHRWRIRYKILCICRACQRDGAE